MNAIGAIDIPPMPAAQRYGRMLFCSVLAGLLAWSFYPAEIHRAPLLLTDAGNMAKYAAGFLTPNFADWRIYATEMLVTVHIAVCGTFLAIVFGIPFAPLSSNNVAPFWIVQPVRRPMDACRAINELVFAVLFVVAAGLGPAAAKSLSAGAPI